RRDSSPALRASVANRVGGRRGCLTAPFPPPPSEPDWRLSYSSGSPVVRSGLPLPEWWPCRFSAPHVACLPAVPPTSRPPFATWTAFPSSDSYGDSVAMGPPLAGLLPWRRSCFSYHVTYRDRFRSPTHPWNRVHLPDRCTGRSCRPPDGYGRHPIH